MYMHVGLLNLPRDNQSNSKNFLKMDIYTIRKHIIIMTICGQCGGELPEMARFCPNCGVETRIRKDIFDIPSEGLISRVKELMHDVSVKRIVVKDDKGKVLLSIPVTWGTAGVIATVALAPWLAALGVIAALVAKCRVEVEREFDDKNSIDGNI
jgi:ribosomal protein L40E